MSSTHNKRFITGVVLALFFLWVIFFSNPFVFSLAFSFISGVCLWEFYSLFWQDRVFFKSLGILFSFLIVISNFLKINPLFFLLAFFWIINLFFLYFYGGTEKSFKWRDIQIFTSGLIYIPLIFFLLTLLKREEVFFVLLASFSSDIGAYYVGTWTGRKKLWPKISPNKSWMGAFGGLFLCMSLCSLVGFYLNFSKWYWFVLISILLNIAAQLGDLFESALKRSLNAKDSGSLLPGHGGFLDRFDSVLFVIPVYFVIRWFYPII